MDDKHGAAVRRRGIAHRARAIEASFEGQAAMAVQFAAEQEAEAGGVTVEGYPMDLVPSHSSDTKWMIDWRPMVSAMLDDLRRGCRLEYIAARFHVGLAEVIVRVAQAAGFPRVVLTGGCFQNRLLLVTRETTVGECRIHRL